MMKGGNDMSNTYTTISGDRWDGIAYKEMGSESYMNKLIEANKKYRDTYIFSAGVVLTIPDIDTKVSAELPPWKRVTT
jgi:hypothetical protein